MSTNPHYATLHPTEILRLQRIERAARTWVEKQDDGTAELADWVELERSLGRGMHKLKATSPKEMALRLSRKVQSQP